MNVASWFVHVVPFLIIHQTGIHEEAQDQQRVWTTYRQVRSQEAKSAMQSLWMECQADCTCLGTPVGSGPASQDANCPYCLCTEQGEEVHTVARICGNTECRICALINKCDLGDGIRAGVSKNSRLTALLDLSQYIATLLNSTDLPEERRSSITHALCCICSCKITRLRNMANVGFLTELCPHLKLLQLQKGWGDFWNQLSKLGTAIGYHQNRESQIAALIYIRRQCIRDVNSHWHWYLQSDDLAKEQHLNCTVFDGCFPETTEPAGVVTSTA